MKTVFGDREEALYHLSEVAVETVQKDIESYMFVNMITGNREGIRSEVG